MLLRLKKYCCILINLLISYEYAKDTWYNYIHNIQVYGNTPKLDMLKEWYNNNVKCNNFDIYLIKKNLIKNQYLFKYYTIFLHMYPSNQY